MGSARTVTVEDLTTLFNFELRNSDKVQWEADETLAYVNKFLEIIHIILAEHESDLVKTGTGSFTTSEGIELYDLSDNSMGDLLYPCTVWLSGLGEIEQAEETDRMPHVISKEQGNTSYNQPSEYYIEGDNIGLLPFPDSTTYTVKLKYVPDYAAVVLGRTMPYKNLFNGVLVEGVKIIAKNRENDGSAVDAAIMELCQDRAMSVLRKRQKQTVQLTPYLG